MKKIIIPRPRSVYIQEFVKYVTQYYDYNDFLADKFFQLFGRSVMDAFDANEDERPLSIRPNLLKTTKSDLVTVIFSHSYYSVRFRIWNSILGHHSGFVLMFKFKLKLL